MSATVYSVAMAVHKGMLEVLEGFQKLGADVRRLDDQVDDDYIYKLAGHYGRRGNVIPLLSTKYMEMLDEPYDSQELCRYILPFFGEGEVLTGSRAERIYWTLNQLKQPERIITEEPKSKVPKACRGIHLIGCEGEGLAYTEGDVQLFLLPQTKGEVVQCRLCLAKDIIIDTNMVLDGCRVLAYINGKYLYEPAEFIKVRDIYYFDAANYLGRRGINLMPVYGHYKYIYKRDIKKFKRWLLPSLNGFVLQEDTFCTMKFDRERLRICNGIIEKITWNAQSNDLTIKGRAAVRHGADALLSLQGEIGMRELRTCLYKLVSAFRASAALQNSSQDGWYWGGKSVRLPYLFIKTDAKTYGCGLEDQDVDEPLNEFMQDYPQFFVEKQSAGAVDVPIIFENKQEQEAYERLILLENEGLSPVPAQAFAENKTLYISKRLDARVLQPMKNPGYVGIVSEFEKTFDAKAYLCILSKSSFGRLLSVFYVSNQPDEWSRDREWLLAKNPIVYVANLDDEDMSDIGGIKFHISQGGINRIA